mgnify:FL=1
MMSGQDLFRENFHTIHEEMGFQFTISVNN